MPVRTAIIGSLAACALAAALSGCASAGLMGPPRIIEDPVGDDHGPGNYVYPQGALYTRGAFDLREVALAVVGDQLEIAVRFVRPVPIARGVRLTREQRADVFIATVDIYLDTDLEHLSGESRGLPGRSVRLPEGMGWESAIVVSPTPSRLRSVLAASAPGTSLYVPDRVRVTGDTLRARVSVEALGGRRLEDVAIGVAVTGAVFTTSFRTLIDGQIPTALVREVTEQPGRCDRWDEDVDGAPCTFGGCDPCTGHPRVIDALHPLPGEQERSLSDRDANLQRLARLPMVMPAGRTAPAVPLATTVEVPVTDRRGTLVTVMVAIGRAPPRGGLVDGLDASGAVVATLVVATVAEGLDPVPVVLRVAEGDAARVTTIRWRTWSAEAGP